MTGGAPGNPDIVAEVDLAISGMTCAACVARVEKKLSKIEGVSAVVNLATERARIEISGDACDVSDAQLIETVEKAGYGARLIQRRQAGQLGQPGWPRSASGDIDVRAVEAAAQRAGQQRIADMKRRLVVSAILSVPIVVLSMIPALEFRGWQWLVAALSFVVAFWCGWQFHRNAARAIRYGSTTMDTLVSLGVLASMGWSLWALLWGGAGTLGYTMTMSGAHSTAMPHLYFESAAMIVTFLLAGRLLEARSRRSAGEGLRALLDLAPQEALRVRRSDGSDVEEVVPIGDVLVGDVFRVRPGEKVATDGVVVAGQSAVDSSLVTGESVPVEVCEGSEVIGATLNTYSVIDVRATRIGEDTTLAHMGRLLTEAQSGKAPVQRLADRISAVFVPIVIALACLDFLVRFFVFGNSVEMALSSAIAVVVVACPCALGLATPTALLVGSARAAQLGILIKGAQVLENAHRVDTIVLDKTGTLTCGQMSLRGVTTGDGSCPASSFSRSNAAGAVARDVPESLLSVVEIACALGKNSKHPVAQAIARAGSEQSIAAREIRGFRSHAGAGVSGQLDTGENIALGQCDWVEDSGFAAGEWVASALSRYEGEGATVSVLGVDGRIVAAFAVGDEVRGEAREALEQLRGMGVRPVMVTGDNEATARAVGQELGIDDVRAGVLPQGKVELVSALREDGATVAMVGDGVNDAPALAGADLSLAMGSGTDVAQASSDITIVNSSLLSVPSAVRISRRTLRIIKENLAWAFGYNLIAIPLAAGGLVLPGLAAAAMACSSVIVVLNSLRLRRA